MLLIGWILLLGQPTAVSTKLRMIFAQLSTPFVRLGDHIPTVKSRRDLEAQNRDLRAANTDLRLQVQRLSELNRETLRANRLKDYPTLRTLGARVIGRDASNWWKSLQIDRGSNDGLRENLAVINADGLVGKIIHVSRGEARVLLLTDPNCKASALLQESREPGVVTGLDSLEPRLQITYISRQAVARVGDLVISSGLGGVFPKGIPIGTVLSGRLNPETGMYHDLELKPVVDFRRLEEVLVVLE
ncbi:MAG: Cell shape-determining protein MreC [Verrucomicrobiae bacterium]|nr:Cell shape-determining protein MreC [Verrucomicrobiae bacterium]